MRIRLLVPALVSTALTLLAFGACQAQAGSFFGPSCYGSDYTNQYPNRSHNVFGCGPCTRCQAWHPFFPRLCHRKQNIPNDGMSFSEMPTPNITNEHVPAPLVPSPATVDPIHRTSGVPVPREVEPPLVDAAGHAPY